MGLDLSETNDNTSVSMVSVDDDNNILADSWAFIPAGRVEEKTQFEKVNYQELAKKGHVIPCGDMTIGYDTVERFIFDLEERLGVQIQAIGYDRWNALSTAQKLENGYVDENGKEHHGFNMVEIKQHSSVLHPPTKLLKEKILNHEFKYTDNKLLEINFQNARCAYDTNKNMYVQKKRSKGKVDMVVSLIDATYLAQQDILFGDNGFVVQVL